MLIKKRGCPICGSRAYECLHSQRFILPEGHPLAHGYDVACCVRCGFVYADTSVGQSDYDVYYSSLSRYQDSHTSTGSGVNPVDEKRLNDTANLLAKTVPNQNTRILDVGCANGGLLKALKNLGYARIVGVDPSKWCVDATRRSVGCDAVVGSLSSIPADLGFFDMVVLSHVLEHVQDLAASMRAVRGLLIGPGGLVYVEVPDATRYAECLVAPFQDFNTEHINHFSIHCLRLFCSLSGFKEESFGQKTIFNGPRMPYPALFGFFADDSKSAALKVVIERDVGLLDRIRDYIRASAQAMREIDEKINKVLRRVAEIVVWGTGELAMKMLSDTCLRDARIVAFVDGNPVNQGRLLLGRPVLSPSEARDLCHPILITSIIHGREIARDILEKYHMNNEIICLDTE